MHYAIINYGRLRSYTDAASHVTLHFELQRRILEILYFLSLLYNLDTVYILLVNSEYMAKEMETEMWKFMPPFFKQVLY